MNGSRSILDRQRIDEVLIFYRDTENNGFSVDFFYSWLDCLAKFGRGISVKFSARLYVGR